MREEILQACRDFDMRVPEEIFKLYSREVVYNWIERDMGRLVWKYKGEMFDIAYSGLKSIKDEDDCGLLSCYCLTSSNGPIMFVYCDTTTKKEIRDCLFRATGIMGYSKNPFAVSV